MCIRDRVKRRTGRAIAIEQPSASSHRSPASSSMRPATLVKPPMRRSPSGCRRRVRCTPASR
eukprot:8422641-Alexandrium_andersonii.AAC.1